MSVSSATLIKRFVIALVVAWIVLVGYLLIADMSKPKTTLQLGTGVFRTEVVADETAREQGLSGKDMIDKTHAMLFVFPKNDTWGIWMKDMNFPIDIVWLNDKKTVVYLKRDASPDNYPEIYKPAENARYVIEFAAGTIKDKDIRVGSVAKFENKEGK